MAESIGVTFAPTPENAGMSPRNWAASGGAPEAVQILSLHVPKFAGVRALAPDALLQAQPHQAVASVVESVLRDLGHAPPQQGGSQESMGLADLLRQVMGSAQTPRVTPGVEPTPMQAGPMLGLTQRPTTPPLTNIQAPMVAPDRSPWAGNAQALFDQHR